MLEALPTRQAPQPEQTSEGALGKTRLPEEALGKASKMPEEALLAAEDCQAATTAPTSRAARAAHLRRTF